MIQSNSKHLNFLNKIKKDKLFIKFLHLIDMLDEQTLRETIFKHHKYIDTPGTFTDEYKDWSDIIEFYYYTAGFGTLQKLWKFFNLKIKQELRK